MIAVQLFIKKNTIVVSGTITDPNIFPYTGVKDSTASFAVNEFKGHYIKITKGTGVGSVAWIVSNTSTILTLQTGIQTDATSAYKIYRADYQKLDLFKEEKISLTSQIANANDIGKVFTDFSQSFTIPASKRNNKILSHWYESSIDDGFDHRVRYDGFIEINTQRFKDGNFQLEKASKKNGFIESYTVTFYGNLIQLKDILQDDKLASLDFSIYNHVWDYANVQTRIESITTTGDIKYPLIGSKRKFYYKDASHPLEDITTTAGAINWNELFPAIKISNIFLRIKAKYGIDFTGSFLNEDQFKKLYLYLKPATELSFISEPKRLNYNVITLGPFPQMNLATDIITINFITPNNYRTITMDTYITPQAGYTTVPYTIIVYKNNIVYRTYPNLVGSTGVQLDRLDWRDYQGTIQEYYCTIAATGNFQYDSKIEMQIVTSAITVVNYRADANIDTIYAYINIGNYIPDMKISDFITGIVKAFNLMIIPKANNVYDLSHLEMYYNAGKILDITKYTYSNDEEIERPKLFKSINLTYEKSTNVLNNAFKGLWGTDYGDLIYRPISSNESSSYDVKLPFENVLFERAVNSQFETATIVDKDMKPYIPKPMLIYCNSINTTPFTGTDRIQLKTPTSYVQLATYNRFSNEYDSFPADPLHVGLMTMNFGNEQSPWLNVLAPRGLYFRQYKNYIDNLYNIKTRIVKIKALLPPSLMTLKVLKGTIQKCGISLNDRLIIRNKRYIINSFTTDLTSGETDFELITDYRGVNAASTVGYRFANNDDIKVDKTAQDIEVVIYLNDYDYFGVKAAINYLIYPITGLPEYQDLVLPVTILENTSGVDRYDEIGIEYYRDGVLEVTEYINVTQFAI